MPKRYCCVFGCHNNDSHVKRWDFAQCETHKVLNGTEACNCELPYYLVPFPTKDNNLRQEWITRINRKDFKPNYDSRICSVHFVQVDKRKRKLLKEYPYPTLKLGYGLSGQRARKKRKAPARRFDSPPPLAHNKMEVNIDRVKSKLKDALRGLFQDDFGFASEACFEGLIGITLDKTNIMLVNLNESMVKSEQNDVNQLMYGSLPFDVALQNNDPMSKEITATDSGSKKKTTKVTSGKHYVDKTETPHLIIDNVQSISVNEISNNVPSHQIIQKPTLDRNPTPAATTVEIPHQSMEISNPISGRQQRKRKLPSKFDEFISPESPMANKMLAGDLGVDHGGDQQIKDEPDYFDGILCSEDSYNDGENDTSISPAKNHHGLIEDEVYDLIVGILDRNANLEGHAKETVERARKMCYRKKYVIKDMFNPISNATERRIVAKKTNAICLRRSEIGPAIRRLHEITDSWDPGQFLKFLNGRVAIGVNILRHNLAKVRGPVTPLYLIDSSQ